MGVQEENKEIAIPIKFRTKKDLFPLFKSLEGNTLAMEGLRIQKFKRRIGWTFYDVNFQLKPNGSKAEFEIKEKAWQEKFDGLEKKFEPIIAQNTEMSGVIDDLKGEIEEKKKQIINLQALNKQSKNESNKELNTLQRNYDFLWSNLLSFWRMEENKWKWESGAWDKKRDDHILKWACPVKNIKDGQTIWDKKSFDIPKMVYQQIVYMFRGKNSPIKVEDKNTLDFIFTYNNFTHTVPLSFIEYADKPKVDWFSKELNRFGYPIDVPQKKAEKKTKEVEESDKEEQEVQETNEAAQNETQESPEEQEKDPVDEIKENIDKQNLKNKYFSQNTFPLLDNVDRKIIETMIEENLIEGENSAKLGNLISEVRRRNPDIPETIIQKRVVRHLLKNEILIIKKAEDNPRHNEYALKKMEVE
jgi:hypothetical protein